LAREGVDVKLQPRTITIYSFGLTRFELPEIDFKVVCSTGTYIRSLANDVGETLGCGGYLSLLRRTRIGSFSVEDAVPLDIAAEKAKSFFHFNKEKHSK
jgi:tRNA pseudouridine55 synthase